MTLKIKYLTDPEDLGMKKRFVIVGASSRALSSYGRPLAEMAKERVEIRQFGYGDDAADRDAPKSLP